MTAEIYRCKLCDEDVPTLEIVNGSHVRLLHPDVDVIPEYWPDGLVVVYDDLDEEGSLG